MPLILSMLAPLLILQVGPFNTPQPQPLRPPPTNPRRAKAAESAPAAASVPGRLAACLELAGRDAAAALAEAQAWNASATAAQAGPAAHCLGVVQLGRQDWGEAETALLRARDAAGESDHPARARLGGLAGFAALQAGHAERALALLDPAAGEADLAGDAALAGPIELDRARALVALRRLPEAATALARARGALATDPEVWLLSATLSRRTGALREAQVQIEEAARLAPTDPAVGLEAGLIAALAGRNQSARASWDSVIAVAPGSDEAKVARGYLEQLGGP